MAGWGAALAAGVVVAAAVLAIRGWQRRARRRAAGAATLLPRHRAALLAAMPALREADAERAESALRQFFRARVGARRELAMPSVAAATLWRAFSRDGPMYARFCEQAFGNDLPWRPAEVLGPDAARNDALRRTWFRCCAEEGIDPRHPGRLPLLFALDAAIAFPGGIRYQPAPGPQRRRDDGEMQYGVSFGDGEAACGDAAGFGGECGGDGGGSADGGGGDGGGGD